MTNDLPVERAETANIADFGWFGVRPLAGTGFAPQRLALIAIEDNNGLTAADAAERRGHQAIADLLRGQQARMEFFE